MKQVDVKEPGDTKTNKTSQKRDKNCDRSDKSKRDDENNRTWELYYYRRILSVKGGTIHNEYLLTANRVRAVGSRIRLHP